jgi:hypothetical protein
MKESEKLTIRFNFKSQREPITKNKVESEYHWGRIIGCTLAVVIVGGTLVVGNNYFFNQNESQNQQVDTSPSNMAESTTLISATVPESRPESESADSPVSNSNAATTLATVQTNTEKTSNITDQTEEQTTVTNLPEQTLSGVVDDKNADTKTNVESNVNTATINNAVLPITEKSISPETKQAAVKTINDHNSPSKTAVSEPSTINTSSETSASRPLFNQSKLEILSDNVERFIIAPRVINNEPIGTIDDIEFDENIAAVFAFTEVTDLKDTSLYYYWILNGEEISKVRIDVGSKSWRTYSSKIIQPHMRGEWTVEMQNKNGDTLAVSHFTY